MAQMNDRYRDIIERVLQEYAAFFAAEDGVEQQLIFDRQQGHYLLVESGWQQRRRIYGTFIHLDLIDDKVWIQHDGTEDGVAYELEAAGIPKQQIVLAFKSLERRQLTEYAVC